ncbi:Macrolide export protein MacA [Sporomusa ovata DSM 2662]|uniref:Probable Co/Zn/Cd efflux system membrane fusion protein n=1 Tax=Sporomusa ovata TaxID=2378 RepID=A0A0U1KSN4_9FIRM|nr:efflux RND transporter periplasmic adaptor subunit [Sporomusa ovata]EQB26200.1 RND family efflux transporter, MFP subunit [Sporomusa ovata DSM 2662]CQR70275.1 Probable Co/Zn/Cd efflux system membrane fusion protein [Sporomusa ovata]
MQIIWDKCKKYKGWVFGVVILAILVAGGTAYYKRSSRPVVAPPVTATVKRCDIKAGFSATGTVQPVNSIKVASRVTGLIKEVCVKENDIVKKGQVLFILDDSAVRAQVALYRATLEKTAAIYERSKLLAAAGGESRQQMESDRADYLVAKANYENYSAQLDYYVIYSPADGKVIGTPTPAGQTIVQGVSEAQTVLTIADESVMQVKVLVDESDIGAVAVGQPAQFTVDAQKKKTFTGKVSSISSNATTSSNVVYYPVYVDVDNPDGLLRPTMTARITIHFGESNGCLVIPLTAVKDDKGQKCVQKLVDGKMQKTPVELGLSDDAKVEVINGLNEGDEVLLFMAKAGNSDKKK